MARTPEIVPFSDAHTNDAARLLAVRQARLRADLAALPERWCDPAEGATRIEALRSAIRLERVIDARVPWAGGA